MNIERLSGITNPCLTKALYPNGPYTLIPPASVSPEVLFWCLADAGFQVLIQLQKYGMDVFIFIAGGSLLNERGGTYFEPHGSGTQALRIADGSAGYQVHHSYRFVGRCWMTEKINHHTLLARMLIKQQGENLFIV